MGAKAYVLISTVAEKTSSVVQELRKLSGVTAADLVSGPYDVVAVVQGRDANVVDRIILNDIRGVPGMNSTLTCLVIEIP